jgi:hypothetical protein
MDVTVEGIVKDVNPVLANALLPIVVMVGGSFTVDSAAQPPNALAGTSVNVHAEISTETRAALVVNTGNVAWNAGTTTCVTPVP